MSAATRAIHLVTDHIREPGLRGWASGFVDRLRRQGGRTEQVVESADEADWVVFLETGVRRTGWYYLNTIRRHPAFRRHAERCFVWCTEDRPLSVLPGVYASLPAGRFDRRYHRAFTYFELPNELAPVTAQPRDLLYSFVGGPTHDVRRRLMTVKHPADTLVRLTANFNHGNPLTADTRGSYAAVLARSAFALCPRGVGTSSYRLFESMRFGCVPVVISDDFVLPDGPTWPDFMVRVGEGCLDQLPELLNGLRESAAGMGAKARLAYEEYFSPGRHLHNLARLLDSLGSHPRAACRWAFHRQQVEDLAGRIARRLTRR